MLKTPLRQLRLPTMGREFETLARDAAASNQTFAQFLLRLTEIELATRSATAITAWIKDAGFPVEKDFDTYDFNAMPNLSKPKVLELVRCEWGSNRNPTVAWWEATGLGRRIFRYVTMSWDEVALLFRVFADQHERGSILVTSSLPLSEWGQVFQGERTTAVLLDRLCHHCHIFEMNSESYRFRESMKTKKGRKGE